MVVSVIAGDAIAGTDVIESAIAGSAIIASWCVSFAIESDMTTLIVSVEFGSAVARERVESP